MAQTPPMNLPPAATPWGRAMQGKIEELERSAARREQAEANANQGQNATLAAMAKQIVTLGATQTTLAQQQTDLETAQTALATAQTDLATTMSRTSLSVAVRVTTNDFDVPAFPGYKELSTTLVVPADVTSCTVIVSASVSVNTTGADDKELNLALYAPISGNGHQQTVQANTNADLTGTWTGVLLAVTPGDTLTFMARAASMTIGSPFPRAGGNSMEINAVVIFKY